MAEVIKSSLNTTALERAYQKNAQDLPVSERFGSGRRYRFGTTHVDVFPSPPGDLAPAVRIGLRRGSVILGDVQDIAPGKDGGMTILHPDGGINVSKTGDVALLYVAPAPPAPDMRITIDGKKHRDVRGNEYVQDMMESGDDAEKADYRRIEVIVGSVPVAVTKQRGAPLRFTAYEKLSPDDPTQEKEWEVKAYNRWVKKTKELELKPGDKVFVVGVRKHWTQPKAGGGLIDYECLNVVNLQVRERKSGKVRRTKPSAE